MTSPISKLQNLSAPTRLGWALGLAILIWLLLPPDLHLSTRLLATWCTGAGSFLILVLIMMHAATAEVTRERSQRYSAHPITMFLLPMITACASLMAITLLLSSTKNAPAVVVTVHIGLAALAIFCSWCLLPVTFARRYATLYYRPWSDGAPETATTYAQGLNFVESTTPTYWDFLYFSSILSATAQTADTTITSRSMRRLALCQCLISFFYFVGVMATAVNIGSGVLSAAHH